MNIAIIGGGASGMAAAIAAAQDPRNTVTVFERQNRVGRKLLATGNGRCNLTNSNTAPSCYHGENPAFVIPAISRYGYEETLSFFHSLGLLTVREDSGREYPWSDQAGSVVDVLRFALELPNITLRTGFEVKKLQRSENGFLVVGEEKLPFDRVIVACGGLAGTALGGSMSGYQLLRSMGHSCTRLRPALVQLKSSYPRCASLKGIRAVCSVLLTLDGKELARSSGEVQFTQYGLSGPAIFEISRWACASRGTWCCDLDLLPPMSAQEILVHLQKRRAANPRLESGELLTGTVHNRLGKTVLLEAGVSLNHPLEEITDTELSRIADTLKCFSFSLTETLGMDAAQVTAGGILTDEFDPMTMESKLVPGLYACGEVLDVDGDCGGFNLQWAWSSGRVAGTSAGGGTYASNS